MLFLQTDIELKKYCMLKDVIKLKGGRQISVVTLPLGAHPT